MKKVFSNRNFSLIFFGNFVSSIGSSVYNFGIGWYILRGLGLEDNKAIHFALYMATGAVIQLLLAPFGGVIADRLDKVKIVYITDFIRGIVIAVAGVLFFTDLTLTTTFILLYTCTIVLAVNGALFGPAISSLQTEVVDEEDLLTAQATMSMINSFRGIIGVFLGGAFMAILGIKWIFIINAVSFIFSGFSEMFIKHKFDKEFDDKLSLSSGLKELKEGIKYLRSIRGLVPLMICALFLNFAFTPMFTNGFPYLFEDILKTSPLHLSLVEVGISIGSLIGAIVIGNFSRRINTKKAVYNGLTYMVGLFIIVTGLIYFVIEGQISYYVFFFTLIGMMFIEGIVNMYVNVPLQTSFVKKISPDYRGRAFAVISTLSMAAIPLAIVIGGIIIEYAGIVVLGLYSVVIVLIILFAVLTNRSIKDYLESCKTESKEATVDL
ncbi:MFS transporter [Mycoplasmatota bacterium WC44]